jgi:hypothetical protein
VAFRFLLRLEDGQPNDPAAFETVAPGDVIPLGRGEELRVIAVATDIHQELVDEGFNGVTTVAPA